MFQRWLLVENCQVIKSCIGHPGTWNNLFQHFVFDIGVSMCFCIWVLFTRPNRNENNCKSFCFGTRTPLFFSEHVLVEWARETVSLYCLSSVIVCVWAPQGVDQGMSWRSWKSHDSPLVSRYIVRFFHGMAPSTSFRSQYSISITYIYIYIHV